MMVPVFVQAAAAAPGGTGGWQINRNMASTGLNNTSVAQIIFTILQWLLLILTFLAVMGFVISGIMYITAGGSDRADEARKWLTYSIIGIIVALLGYVMTTFISTMIGGQVQQEG
ncbi:hypothetical protein HN784_01425 [bacterium]|nr:hypothetical protein [bacterium]MBT7431488.1 hypothetical protein [bacterium]MBT7552993.1 hypothetical protein [bacterium]MBT7992414.1 hypothetical protein [bacterium]